MRMAVLLKTITMKWKKESSSMTNKKLKNQARSYWSPKERENGLKRTQNYPRIGSNCWSRKSRRRGRRSMKRRRKQSKSCSKEWETRRCKDRRRSEWRRSSRRTWFFKSEIIKSDSKWKRESRKENKDIFKRLRLRLRFWKTRRTRIERWLRCRNDRRFWKIRQSSKWSKIKRDS